MQSTHFSSNFYAVKVFTDKRFVDATKKENEKLLLITELHSHAVATLLPATVFIVAGGRAAQMSSF